MASKTQKLTQDQMLVAHLAAGMLPPLSLPANWETKKFGDLKECLSSARRVGRAPFSVDQITPPGEAQSWWPTLWEVMAEEAVNRAQDILRAVRGDLRAEVREAHAWFDAKIEVPRADADRWEKAKRKLPAVLRAYDRKYPKGGSISVEAALALMLPECSKQMQRLYFSEWWPRFVADKNKTSPIQLPCNYAPGDPLPLNDMWWSRATLAKLYPEFWWFFETNGKSLRLVHAKRSGSKGGKRSASKRAHLSDLTKEEESILAKAAQLSGLSRLKARRGKKSN